MWVFAAASVCLPGYGTAAFACAFLRSAFSQQQGRCLLLTNTVAAACFSDSEPQ